MANLKDTTINGSLVVSGGGGTFSGDIFANNFSVDGGIRVLSATSDAISVYLTELGFTLDNTLLELYNMLPGVSLTYLFLNSNSTSFNSTLPTSSGGLLVIEKYGSRGYLRFENYRNGGMYTCGLIDGVLTEWIGSNSYALSYPTDTFSSSQCLCRRIGDIVHVYVSLKTSAVIAANTIITLTGHPITPIVQYFRTLTYGGSDVQVKVSSEIIEFSVVNDVPSGSWLRFAFSYISTN